jgi:CheY-like chemotaxis protein/predicted Zn-dependent protease
MALTTNYSNKSLLILDDMPEARSSLRSQVGMLGFERIAVSGNVKDALDQFRKHSFDVILSDYYLGEGTDGQQFLEFLRTRGIIGRGVLFIMVTAEKRYENVVTAAECLPDDYLLKPFTAEVLKLRLERLLEKKQRLARIDKLQDRGDWNGVVLACDEIIGARDRYMVDAMRIKGNALLAAGRHDDAVVFYQLMLLERPLPWSKLGLARALHLRGDNADSKDTLSGLIAEAPQLMAAYDLLGKVHLASGDADAALAVLDSACAVSPNSLARHRAVATVAEEKGDFKRVEQALDKVVRRTRNTPLRETHDIARLGNALTEIGEPAKAVSLISEALTNFKGDVQDPMLAAVEAVAQQKAGNPDKARAALDRALQADATKLPVAATMAVAKACLSTGRHDEAQGILRKLVQTHHEATDLHQRVSSVLRDHGAAAIAESLVADSVNEIIQLNNDAVKRARAGELGPAAQMLTEAAQRLPGNLQIVANAAAALYFDVLHNGLDAEKVRQAQVFQKAVQAAKPGHPKLAEIAALVAQIREKYATSAQ